MKYIPLTLCALLCSSLCQVLSNDLNSDPLPVSTSREEEFPVVILGSGVAALTSATYLARASIKPLVLTGLFLGGAITQSHCVQNWPGELEISGFDLIEKMRYQAEVNGALLRPEIVVNVDFSQRPFTITTQEIYAGERLKKIKAHACIIALGATPNLLGIPGETGETGYWSRGVYSCAVCDGGLYQDKVVAVVGGGDSALTEAHYLSKIAKKVYLIVRRDEFRSVEKERAKEILSHPNVEVVYHTTVQEIKGDGEQVSHLVVYNSQNHMTRELPVDALFLAIGAKPNTEMFRNQLQLDENGYVVLKKGQETSVEGVYAVGDIADPEFKQAVSAAGDAAKAALQAHKYLTTAQARPILAVSNDPTVSPVIDIHSKKQLAKELRHWDGLVFIDFYSAHCGPCRAFSPTYFSWAKEFRGRIKFLKVNSADAPELFDKYRIRGVPTLIILDGSGSIVKKYVGAQEISVLSRRMNALREEPVQGVVDPQFFR